MLVSSLLTINSFPGWPFCKGFVCSYNLLSYHTCDLFLPDYDNPVDCPQGTKCRRHIDLNCTIPENDICQTSQPLHKLPLSFYFTYTEEVKKLPTMNTTTFYYVHGAQDHDLNKYYSSKADRTTNGVKFEIVREYLGRLEMVRIFDCFFLLFCFLLYFSMFSCSSSFNIKSVFLHENNTK